MKQKLILLLLLSSFNIASCKQVEKTKDNEPTEIGELVKGAFPIFYKGHLYIIGCVDSICGNYVFDTGASNLYFDSTFYANNNFSHNSVFTGYLPGVGNRPQKVVVVEDDVNFRFGNNSYKTSRVPVIQLKSILGDIADGIIGLEYFHNKILEINYQKEYMRIYSCLDSVDLKDWSKIELIKRANRLFIPLEIQINDTITISGEFIVDFGSGRSVSLTSLISDKYKLKESVVNKAEYYTRYGGVGGESLRYDFFAKQLKIGNFSFKNVLMDFSADTGGALASDKFLGLLGNDIYERFDIIIDLIDTNLYLKPNSRYNEEFLSSRIGFSYVDRGQTLGSWIVTGLYSKSLAKLNGLMIDDEIISINGINVSEIKIKDQVSFFKDIDDVNLKIRRANKFIDISFRLEPILVSY